MAGLQKILLVEDNPELREMYKTFLEFNGYTVMVAIDGDDGLVQSRDFKPDIIFLDIMMPKKDGFEVLRELRHNPKHNATHAKIIMLTNLADSKISSQAKHDMDGYVIKADIELDDLLKVIESIKPKQP